MIRRGQRQRVDANQGEIVKALRRAGASVEILSGAGDGCPDLLVGIHGRRNVLVEVKDGTKPPAARRLTDDEQQWHARWQGEPVRVVCDVDQALALLWE